MEANESSRLWLVVINNLKNRSVQDMLFSVWTVTMDNSFFANACFACREIKKYIQD